MIYKNIAAIAAGGAIGAVFRYLINLQLLSTGLPTGTVIENLTGSLMLGMVTGWMLHSSTREWINKGIGVGFCGGFTTMSTLASDSFVLGSQFSFMASVIYLTVSLFGGVLLAFGGLILGTQWSESYRKVRES
ncbi:putative fluoride ion transporter CrcB 2 [Thalassobacillus devorans]|uniref:Fluoride-specific ion channel FluC n=1 Tax=Thalassobacillus devorans TaxID=279813 RepID=A0ABQ1PT78_9BACI|nr:CrcB family protein [Thalassobacillus devorans]NIK30630.1 CrcB protein [Thalassobacillus devorans]GGD02529.1 putative fluoride ion transporter CrcB 2 [Thalassobacillus devorans]